MEDENMTTAERLKSLTTLELCQMLSRLDVVSKSPSLRDAAMMSLALKTRNNANLSARYDAGVVKARALIEGELAARKVGGRK
jgi:hypothetical protein